MEEWRESALVFYLMFLNAVSLSTLPMFTCTEGSTYCLLSKINTLSTKLLTCLMKINIPLIFLYTLINDALTCRLSCQNTVKG